MITLFIVNTVHVSKLDLTSTSFFLHIFSLYFPLNINPHWDRPTLSGLRLEFLWLLLKPCKTLSARQEGTSSPGSCFILEETCITLTHAWLSLRTRLIIIAVWPGLHYNSKNHTPRWRLKILRHATHKETCRLHRVPLRLHRPVPAHRPGEQRNPGLYKPDCCSPERGENPLRWWQCISQACFPYCAILLPLIFTGRLCHLVTHWIEPERCSFLAYIFCIGANLLWRFPIDFHYWIFFCCLLTFRGFCNHLTELFQFTLQNLR